MKLTLNRKPTTSEYTEGRLFIDGLGFCSTIEDTVRAPGEKLSGLTAIPAGTYKVILAMSPRLKKITPRLLNVPNFEGVLIHAGNFATDSSGCILVGEYSSPGEIINSRDTIKRLMTYMNNAMNVNGETCFIEIING